jgi:hypothetical protein
VNGDDTTEEMKKLGFSLCRRPSSGGRKKENGEKTPFHPQAGVVL